MDETISIGNALKKGDLWTRLSALVMGIGMIMHRQVIKGIMVLLCEIAFFFYMINTGFHNDAESRHRSAGQGLE